MTFRTRVTRNSTRPSANAASALAAAEAHLAELSVDNVTLQTGHALADIEPGRHYDVIAVTGSLPVGWTRPYGDGGFTNLFPVTGTNVARVWHDGALQTTFNVTGGVPVTVRFFAPAEGGIKPGEER